MPVLGGVPKGAIALGSSWAYGSGSLPLARHGFARRSGSWLRSGFGGEAHHVLQPAESSRSLLSALSHWNHSALGSWEFWLWLALRLAGSTSFGIGQMRPI